MTLSEPTPIQVSEVKLRNGVWVHETEWHALQNLVAVVYQAIGSNQMTRKAVERLLKDAYWSWRNTQMDLEEELRAIRSLTKIVGELESLDHGDSVADMG